MTDTFARTAAERDRLALVGELADTFKPLAQAVDEAGGFAFESAEKLRASGYTTWAVPEAYGGAGMSVYELVLYQERIAMGDPALALAIGWHMGTVADLAAKKTWSEDRLALFLRAVAAGKLMNRAATEKGTGSPTRGGKMQTTAEPHGDGYVVRGAQDVHVARPGAGPGRRQHDPDRRGYGRAGRLPDPDGRAGRLRRPGLEHDGHARHGQPRPRAGRRRPAGRGARLPRAGRQTRQSG
ncbi:acyl-CoA/acyl-ACP dehydrogenase [Cohnella rhizosphaerae]|uniref:Acyl-CoA/acyl-ACP dehydrogenase n=1 Tax=Cohnella rhizosphaerae TaxID=1457232 RepID=A0A9X4QS34_9BACL|nr:acyl-CoA dehydrogenase family protein [Cohnella rhizosphaerae]MDG0809185.1 acyl-CoA/acyl-ACP dehydrogenase [Cohnella rhizosphaerae]